MRLFSIYFYQKLDKISSSRRKTFLSQFHCSQISFKLCTSVCQTLRRTNNYFNLPMEMSSFIMRYTKTPTQNAVVVSRKSNYRCSPRNRDIMQRRSSFPCELREFLWCKNICFQNRLDESKQILECYHYSLIDVRVSRNNCVDISSFFFLIG